MKKKIVIETPVSQISKAITSLGLSEYLSDGTVNDALFQMRVKHPTSWRSKVKASVNDALWKKMTQDPKYCGQTDGSNRYIMPVGSFLHIVTRCISESGVKGSDKKQRLLDSGKMFMDCITSDCGVSLDDDQSVQVIYTLKGKQTDLTPCTYNRGDSTLSASKRTMGSDITTVASNAADQASIQPTENSPEDATDLSQALNLRDAGFIVGCEAEALRARARRGTLNTFRLGQGRRSYVTKLELIRAYPDKKAEILEFEPTGSQTFRKRVEEQNELKRSADMRKIRVDTENAIHDAYNDMLSAMGTRMRSVRWEVAIVGALAIISLALQLYRLFSGMQK